LGLIEGDIDLAEGLPDDLQGRDLIAEDVGEIGQRSGLGDVRIKRGYVSHIRGFYRAR
jgi:hypothetical protein